MASIISKRTHAQIVSYFNSSATSVYQRRELAQAVKANREKWKLPEEIYFTKVVNYLIKEGYLRRIELQSKSYKGKVRYCWKDILPHQVSLSLKSGSYLSHGSAVFLHGLNDQLPKTIYVNKEQTPKPSPTTPLSQEAIDRAFSNKQRLSNYAFSFDKYKCVLISGKHTNNLEVITLPDPTEGSLSLTSIERTLIDIAVRPAYSGGVYQVLAAFKGAKNRVAVKKLTSILKKLNYKYPYHQTIGFYLKKAGFDSAEVQPLKDLGLNFDFYIDYGIVKNNLEYDKEWKLFFPKGF